MPFMIELSMDIPKKGILSRMSGGEVIDSVAEAIGNYARWWVGSSAGTAWISLNFFPAAENLVIKVEGGNILAQVATSQAGPGFHQYMVSLLDKIAEVIGGSWKNQPGDSTDYFIDRDKEKLQMVFQDWLSDLAQAILQNSEEAELSSGGTVRLCMDIHSEFAASAPILTNLGPRDLEWAKSASRDAWLHRDFFPWWNEKPEPHDFLQRALAMMWIEQTWRQPENSFEGSINDDIHRCLLRAEADSSLPIPYREWAELLHWTGCASLEDCARIKKLAESQTGELIGYRRNPLKQRFGLGWYANLPGSFRLDETDPESDYIFGPGVELRVKVLQQYDPDMLIGADGAEGARSMKVPIHGGEGDAVVFEDGTAMLFARTPESALLASCDYTRENVEGDCIDWLLRFDHENPPAKK